MPTNLLPYLALVPYAAVALGLTATLALFLSLKIEIRRNSRRERRRVDELLERLRDGSSGMPVPETILVPAPGRAGLNINRRTHILRLLRKGEDAAHIAAALGVPQTEVELLVRVQRMMNPEAQAMTQAAAAGRPE
jgi:hypothetical protein